MTKTKRVLIVVTLALCAAPHGSAHAILVDAKPAVNGTVTGPNVHIQLRFNARIDGSRSRLRVVLPDNTVRSLTLSPQSNPAELDSDATGLAHGAYKLQWQVLAGDGHITRGQVPFQVQ